jgi:hypothetical protein
MCGFAVRQVCCMAVNDLGAFISALNFHIEDDGNYL